MQSDLCGESCSKGRPEFWRVFYTDSCLFQGIIGLATLQEHPTDDMPLPHDPDPPPFWAFQNTWVDMQSFTPVLEEALQQADVRLRQGGKGE